MVINFLQLGRSPPYHCNVFQENWTWLFTESVSYSNSCSQTLQKKQRQWISVKCSLYCTSGASLLADHICHQNLGSQLNPFVAFKPHFTRSLVSHNLRTILVTFGKVGKWKVGQKSALQLFIFCPPWNEILCLISFLLISVHLHGWSWKMWSKSSTGHDRCGRSQFSDGFTSAWLLILISTASVHEGVSLYFNYFKTRERTTRSYLDLKGHWWIFLLSAPHHCDSWEGGDRDG